MSEVTSWDSEINPSLNNKYDNLSSNIAGGVVATAVDFGATIWNSLPFTEEVDTYSLLERVDKNAMRVYGENPDTIHTASFIGGIFAPAGLALKGMNAARSGAKGMGWFSHAGREGMLKKIDDLYKAGPDSAKAHRSLTRQLYARGVANGVLDAAAMEVAIVTAMNAHPFMEDYMKDPAKHFLIGLGIGGVVGGGINHIADRFAVKQLTGKADSAAWGAVQESYKPVFSALPQVNKLQMRASNIESLESILAGSSADVLAKQVAGDVLLYERAAQIEEFSSLAKKMVDGLKPAQQTEILNRLAADLRFTGVDSIEFLQVKASDMKKGWMATGAAKIDPLHPTLNFADFFTEAGKARSMVHIPEFNAFVTADEALQYARASVLGNSKDVLSVSVRDAKSALRTTDNDASLAVFSKRSPEVDQMYLQRLLQVDKLDKSALAKAVAAPDDLFTINAIVAKAMKDPDAMEGLRIKLTKNEPNYGALEIAVAKEAAVKASHFQDLAEFAKKDSKFNLGRAGLASDTHAFLRGWTAGSAFDKAQFRMAFTAFLQKGWVPNSRMKEMAREIYESNVSRELRETLKRDHADVEGNIYLYRGLGNSDPRGHTPLDSYTPSHGVALNFAGGSTSRVRIYKVHVDDVVGVVDNGHGELEYLVTAPARQTQASLPAQKASASVSAPAYLNKGVEEVSLAQLSQRLVSLKEDAINSMTKQGFPMEVIAIRTNTPIDTVKAYVGSSGARSLDDLAFDGLPYMTYRNADHVEDYLSPLTQPMVLRTNLNKVPYAQLSAAADVRALDIADREIKSAFLLSSPSTTARAMHDLFFSEGRRDLLDIMRAQLSKAVEGLAGKKFIQSTDFYTRDMGEFGKIASLTGKDVMHQGNEAIKRLVQPIIKEMNAVAKSETALVEINTALAANAAIQGQRRYLNRSFMVPKQVVREGKKVIEWEPALYQGKPFIVREDSVDALLKGFESAGREMYHLKNTVNKILGRKALTDLGFWVPAFNQTNKYIAYVWNKLDDTTSLLWGNTAEELADAMGTYRTANATKLADGSIQVVTKGKEQELFNMLSGRIDPLHTTIANVEKMHKGASAPAIVKANVDVFTDITRAYESYIQASVRNLADLSMSDITGNLIRMSQVDQMGTIGQPLSTVQKWMGKKESPAMIMRNTLLGVNNILDAPAWQAINQGFETAVGVSLTTIKDAWKSAVESLPAGIRKKIAAGEEANLHGLNYEELSRKLEAAGIHNPWKVFDDKAAEMFGVAKLTESTNVTPRLVYASNALTATAVLRFGEIAQPLVNAISLPILTMGAIAERLPATFMGVQKGTAKVPPLQAMMEGIKAMNSINPQFVRWGKAWEEAGYFKPLVSEASDVQQLARSFEPGAIAKIEKALDSKLVEIMSKPADYSETLVRKAAMFTGGNLAKRLYPELDDVGVTIFARDFMDKVVGNYHAAQRPTLFQGSLGAAASLFQTYMLTMAQRVYRQIETKDFKALAKMMLTQQTLFGMGSLPGFRQISETMGEHFSDENVDLTTGTFRALPDKMANIVLYGLPSSMGPAFYSRGELAPRGPSHLTEMPSVNVATQTIQAVTSVMKAATSDSEDVGRAVAQALSMQSISRPLARVSELATGYSVTRQGNTIGVPEEVWTATGVISRMMSTRPLEEAKLRDSIHMDRVYGGIDRKERQKVTAELKTAIRNNSLTDGKISRLAEEYLRTGSPQGWRAAVTDAVMHTNTSGREVFLNKLSLDNPLMHMLNQMDGEY